MMIVALSLKLQMENSTYFMMPELTVIFTASYMTVTHFSYMVTIISFQSFTTLLH